MKSNAMAGAVSLVGVGLCGIAAAMLLQATGTRADASPRAVDAFGPGEPTVVWYGANSFGQSFNANGWLCTQFTRAWSDGRVEVMNMRRRHTGYVNGNSVDVWCNGESVCTTGWTVVSDPSQGLSAQADLNWDEVVDGADLALVIGGWGDAPRGQFPPSDCPLNLINP